MTKEKVFIMYMKAVVPRGNVISCEGEWMVFENLIKDFLTETGYDFNKETIYFGEHYDLMANAGFVVYAHETRRNIFADLYHKQMHMRNLFTLDKNGWGAEHSAMQTLPNFAKGNQEKSIQFCMEQQRQLLKTGASKFAQPKRNDNINFPKSFLFFPLQRPGDYTVRIHAPMSEMKIILMVVRWAESRKQNIVIKLHPWSENDLELIALVEQCAANSVYVFLMEGNVHDFIVRSAGVICINSGVGFESLIHGKPVITLGNCDYKWVTFHASENTLDEARNYVYNYKNEQRVYAWQFVYYYFFYHAYSIEPSHIEASTERLFAYLKEAVPSKQKSSEIKTTY